MIVKKSPAQIAKMQEAGRALWAVMEELRAAVAPGVTTAELDELAHSLMRDAGGTPSFLGYRGYPASICASPNDVIVHGIPDERALVEGDIISLDAGLIIDGWHADCAFTAPVGTVDPVALELIEVTRRSLIAGIEACRPGKRMGDVGHAIQVVAEKAGFSVVREYAGHQIGRQMHEGGVQVPNYGPAGKGLLLEEGMVFAIEPMVNAGDWHTRVLDDTWTVVTGDGSLSAHFEHTVAVTAAGPQVLTAPAGWPTHPSAAPLPGQAGTVRRRR